MIDRVFSIAVGAVFAALISAVSVQTARLSAAKSTLADLRTAIAEERQRNAEAASIASENYRAEEKRRGLAVQAADEAARARSASVSRARDHNAAAVGNGLRIAAQAAAACGGPATPDPAPASVSASAPSPARVLADVLGEAAAEAVRMGAEADQSRVEGDACESSYDQVRAANKARAIGLN